MKCRLCNKNSELLRSHIVPKAFFDYIKKHSLTKGLRSTDAPNKRQEDGLVLPFLCCECEELFSKYEKLFFENVFSQTSSEPATFQINTSQNYQLKYFILSVAWRTLQHGVETDQKMLASFTQLERDRLMEVLENWRLILQTENMKALSSIQMHLIPTDKLPIYQDFPNFAVDNVKIDFKVLGKEDSFDYAFTYVQVPHFIMLCTVWGNTSHLKQYQLGTVIKARASNLPKFLNQLANEHLGQFLTAQSKLSDKQRNNILKRAGISKTDCTT